MNVSATTALDDYFQELRAILFCNHQAKGGDRCIICQYEVY